MDWLKRMCERSAGIPQIAACVEEVEKWEPFYFSIRDSLPEEQRIQLENYIIACEELDHAMLALAFEEGRERGQLER